MELKRKLTKEEKSILVKKTPSIIDCVVYFNDYGIIIEKNLKLWVYVLSFIPLSIIEFIYTIWNNGLRYFSFPEKTLMTVHYYHDDYPTNDKSVISKLLEESKNTIDK